MIWKRFLKVSRKDSPAGQGSISIGGDALGPVSATYIGTQVLRGSSVPVEIAAKDPTVIFQAVGATSFIGRTWLEAELDAFMAANECGYIFVEAAAGLGKTAFAASLVRSRRYLSHFSRYSDGRFSRSALQSLSAQLAMNFGVGSVVGNILPEWAQTPSGFESLLGRAAEAARNKGECIVIVVDGLDEAEAVDNDLPFGLPRVLPAGAYIVATYRTGTALIRPDSPSVTLYIDKHDPRNLADISVYLETAARQSPLAGQLMAAGLGAPEFTRLLTERSDGVWIYLRYVLEEIRLGIRQPGTLIELPTGLADYYADQFRRWERDPVWRSELLPLLGTLGAAREPLSAQALAKLTGLADVPSVRHQLDLTLRPLLSIHRDRISPGIGLYEIYHESLRELFTRTSNNSEAGGASRWQWNARTDELREATRVAHSRIADFYLAEFGGLSEKLRLLSDTPGLAAMDNGYALRHLTQHLRHAGRVDDLHELICSQGITINDQFFNTWFAAHDAAGSLATYIGNLLDALGAPSSHPGDGGGVVPIDRTIRYTLMSASVAGRTERVSADLLDQLVTHGIWSVDRALDHARGLTDSIGKSQALNVLIKHASEERKGLITEEALEAALAATDERSRADMLVDLTPHLEGELLVRALNSALALSGSSRRSRSLAEIAKCLPGNLLPLALKEMDERYRVDVLCELALRAPPGRRQEELFATVLTMAKLDGLVYLQSVETLAEHLPAALLKKILEGLEGVAEMDDYRQGHVLVALAPHLPERLLHRAVRSSLAILEPIPRAAALGQIALHTSGALQDRISDDALAAAREIPFPAWRASELLLIIPSLNASKQPEVLAEAYNDALAEAYNDASVENPDATHPARFVEICSRFASLLDYLQPEMRERVIPWALDVARLVKDEYRMGALLDLAAHLPEEMRVAIEGEAHTILLELASAQDDPFNVSALTPILLGLPDRLRRIWIDDAVELLMSSIKEHQIDDIVELAPELKPAKREALLLKCLTLATAAIDRGARARALAALAKELTGQQSLEVLGLALEAAAAIQDDHYRIATLAAIGPYLPPELLERAMIEIASVTAPYTRTRGLSLLAKGAREGSRAPVITAALTALRLVDDEIVWAEQAETLVPLLPDDQKAAFLAEAIDLATATPDPSRRQEALTILAPLLPDFLTPALTDKVLSVISDMSTGWGQTRVLTALAPRLSLSQLEAVADWADGLADLNQRVTLQSVLARYLPEDRRQSLVAQGLDAVLRSSGTMENSAFARTLAELLPNLSDDQAAYVISVIAAKAPYEIGDAISKLGEGRSPGLLLQVERECLQLPDGYSRALALAKFVPLASEGTRTSLSVRAIDSAAALSDEGLDEAALSDEWLDEALQDLARKETLRGFAPYLSAELWPRALSLADEITSFSSRDELIGFFAPYVPNVLYKRLLDWAISETSDKARAESIEALAKFLPGKLLRTAIDAVPAGQASVLFSLLEHVQSIVVEYPTQPNLEAFDSILRSRLLGLGRDDVFGIIAATAAAISISYSSSPNAEIVAAIQDVYTWWP